MNVAENAARAKATAGEEYVGPSTAYGRFILLCGARGIDPNALPHERYIRLIEHELADDPLMVSWLYSHARSVDKSGRQVYAIPSDKWRALDALTDALRERHNDWENIKKGVRLAKHNAQRLEQDTRLSASTSASAALAEAERQIGDTWAKEFAVLKRLARIERTITREATP